MIEGLIGVVVFLILVICGVRIAFAALSTGIITFFLVYGDLNTVGVAISSLFHSETSRFTLTVIPLFVFMGYLAFYYGIGASIYETARCWLARLPGGLAVATVMACAAFGAICGISVAAVAMFGKMAVPEMEKAHYHWSLSIGSVAASGTLADLIPPSTMMILYAMLAEQSVGKLLIAGLIPGIVSAIIYSLMIIFRCIRDRRLGPPGPPSSLRQKFSSLKGMIVVLIIIVIIVGGIYSGFFTPTEAGAWSAFAMLIAAFIVKRGFHWPMLRAALIDTSTTVCMVFILVVGLKIMSTALIGSVKSFV